jgi:uncharacterized protein YbaR (Trm112 family)
MIDKELLDILCCPDTKQSVAPAEADTLEKIRILVEAGDAENVGGAKVEHAPEEGLLREDGKVLYPVRNNIPIMLGEEGIVVPD